MAICTVSMKVNVCQIFLKPSTKTCSKFQKNKARTNEQLFCCYFVAFEQDFTQYILYIGT